jgi:hypothetical protein
MSATFLTLSQGDIFESGGTADHLIKIPKVDDILGESGLAIYNQVSAQINETIQYFLTFDDIIKYIHFGKGLGSVTAEGTMYSDCDGDVPGLSKFASAISGLRGKEQEVVIGGMTLTVVMTSAQVNVVSDPDTMAHFIFNFAVVNHHL